MSKFAITEQEKSARNALVDDHGSSNLSLLRVSRGDLGVVLVLLDKAITAAEKSERARELDAKKALELAARLGDALLRPSPKQAREELQSIFSSGDKPEDKPSPDVPVGFTLYKKAFDGAVAERPGIYARIFGPDAARKSFDALSREAKAILAISEELGTAEL